jgi:hypothetical protein
MNEDGRSCVLCGADANAFAWLVTPADTTALAVPKSIVLRVRDFTANGACLSAIFWPFIWECSVIAVLDVL